MKCNTCDEEFETEEEIEEHIEEHLLKVAYARAQFMFCFPERK